ncbi:GrpB family protein [Psychromicrobium lacuslunae]|uniref:GrpB family protein n=1 Tax=Psychromicrobium lacuslunae TaxID=1618207 RepID=A0A0D4C3F8_9MICC|nr:GrpB family protein [Psychromicrobium lacuslunae]AJT42945.1 hypothetical protein UM93_06860 [Psychromicrobium lacuslunae]
MPADSPRRRPDVDTVELIGGIEKRALSLNEYDPSWPEQFDLHRVRVSDALGATALLIEHIGSTSVPGLAAKPIIDILVVVSDITAEEDYLDQLLAAGYRLRVREPGHRLVRTEQLDVHIHLLETADPAIEDYLLLRDQLRNAPADREQYERVKRDLLSQDWPDMNSYAEAKTTVIEEIKARARQHR